MIVTSSYSYVDTPGNGHRNQIQLEAKEMMSKALYCNYSAPMHTNCEYTGNWEYRTKYAYNIICLDSLNLVQMLVNRTFSPVETCKQT